MDSNEMTVREHVKQILRKVGVADRTPGGAVGGEDDLV